MHSVAEKNKINILLRGTEKLHMKTLKMLLFSLGQWDVDNDRVYSLDSGCEKRITLALLEPPQLPSLNPGILSPFPDTRVTT
jgi:hypothetical protein